MDMTASVCSWSAYTGTQLPGNTRHMTSAHTGINKHGHPAAGGASIPSDAVSLMPSAQPAAERRRGEADATAEMGRDKHDIGSTTHHALARNPAGDRDGVLVSVDTGLTPGDTGGRPCPRVRACAGCWGRTGRCPGHPPGNRLSEYLRGEEENRNSELCDDDRSAVHKQMSLHGILSDIRQYYASKRDPEKSHHTNET